jgi:SAM-dependent methyltransferase
MFTSKISRACLDKQIAPHASTLRTLEVGSRGSPEYAAYFPSRIGIDIQAGAGVDVVGSVYALPFPDASFDIVLCISVLEHLEDPKLGIQEMKRVLKPKGKIIVSTPFLFPVHDAPGDYWRFTLYGLKLLFKDWNIQNICAETNTQESIASLLQRIAYQTRMRFNRLTKAFLFLVARILVRGPNMVTEAYGDIGRSTAVPEAFASSLFLVALKNEV